VVRHVYTIVSVIVATLSGMDLVLVLVIGLGVGALLGWFLHAGRVSPADVEPALLEARHAQVVAEIRRDEGEARAETARELAAAQASIEGLRQTLDAARQQYTDAVERTRRDTQERAESERQESKVLQQLAPVVSQLRTMQQKVDEIEKQRSAQHGDLAAQIRATRESAEQSRSAAETLSQALRNNSVRGAYGETQLKSLVESAGLLNRVDFFTQESIEAESGSRRPDMVVRLPGNKQMAVDAKVPFSAFIESSRSDLDETQRKQLQTQHAKQVKGHVDALADKGYWTGLSATPEFTVAFIPNDSILNAALDTDPGLMQHAFDRGIVLATPVNLWAVLKTVSFTWRQEVLSENAKELFDLGNELYSRLATLSDKVAKLGRSIEGSVKSYNEFVGTLERRVLSTARKFDGLDRPAVLGEVATVDSDTRGLTAGEFAALDDLERPELDFALDAVIVHDDEETA
jgi:DNA recombination protein RmuC